MVERRVGDALVSFYMGVLACECVCVRTCVEREYNIEGGCALPSTLTSATVTHEEVDVWHRRGRRRRWWRWWWVRDVRRPDVARLGPTLHGYIFFFLKPPSPPQKK